MYQSQDNKNNACSINIQTSSLHYNVIYLRLKHLNLIFVRSKEVTLNCTFLVLLIPAGLKAGKKKKISKFTGKYIYFEEVRL